MYSLENLVTIIKHVVFYKRKEEVVYYMKEKLKKLFAYYGPYKRLFYSDMFFAILGAAVMLIIPLVVRYITNEVVYFEASRARESLMMLGGVMAALVLLEIFCNFYIAYFGCVQGK